MSLSRMYTSHFCEENTYKLPNYIMNTKIDIDNFDINVIFISSKKLHQLYWFKLLIAPTSLGCLSEPTQGMPH